ncbi:hypothetical protein Dimus_012929 [Dionaea muscipula]
MDRQHHLAAILGSVHVPKQQGVFCSYGVQGLERSAGDHGSYLVECEFSRAVLRWTLHAVRLSLPQSCWRQWWTKVAKGKTDLAKARRRCLAASAYFLWQERNCRVYHISAASPKEVSGKILNFLRLGG